MTTENILNQNSITACTISGLRVEVDLVVNRDGNQLQMYTKSPAVATGLLVNGPAVSVSQEDTSVTLMGDSGTELNSIVISSTPLANFTALYHLVRDNGGSLVESLVIKASSA